jgi:hypothetical protein
MAPFGGARFVDAVVDQLKSVMGDAQRRLGMHDLPADLNIDDIIGSVICQIRIGRYDVQFHFDSGRHISSQDKIIVMRQDELIASWDENSGWSTTGFFLLLNSPIDFYIVQPRQLTIKLKSGISVNLYVLSHQYESMQIYPEGYIF